MLLRAPRDEQRRDAQFGSHQDGVDAHAAVSEFFADDDLVNHAKAQSPHRLRDEDVEQTQLMRLRDDVFGKTLVPIVLGRVGDDDVLGKLPRQRLKLLLFVG